MQQRKEVIRRSVMRMQQIFQELWSEVEKLIKQNEGLIMEFSKFLLEKKQLTGAEAVR
ncbi:hypothetical protein Mgra_00001392 [Meloidogyne graminicola]|uniref:Uncharacterized protein n=1 Tax=Meloidogyne graminicola TaxID=189291 RepID=A0A8T0A1H9_9BILA|nr:hypothetical protein Mgra_00001391 [Meloidogyne graminicola]KAF7639159.1 hypothetical protein Mgra_00001392 [Meloidogyne graminicola]